MKEVTPVEFLAGLEGVEEETEGVTVRLTPDLAWPPIVVGGFVYAMHVSGELWRFPL